MSTDTAYKRIQPSQGWTPLNLRELWQRRSLLYFLVWRILKVRYKQNVIGIAWVILQPFSMMIVFSVFLGALVRVPSGDIPYPLFVFSGLVLWTFFANGFGQSASSIVSNTSLITKVSFPRLTIPAAPVFAGLLDFSMAFLVLLLMMVFYGRLPTLNVIFLPAFLLLVLLTALGVGFWLSTLYVQYRDIHHLLPILTQAWFFSTPVTYPSSLVPESWRVLYNLNPMTVAVDGLRWTMFGTPAPSPLSLGLSGLIALIIFVSGAYYFRQREKSFAERL